MAQLYRERRQQLVKVGYLETREFELPRGLESSKETRVFFYRLSTSFTGAEIGLRGRTSQRPVIVACARERDLLAIQWIHPAASAGK